jgi:hypothetical protein
VERDVRATYGASLSLDATAFAHLVDDGGYPRAVQRFLRGRLEALSPLQQVQSLTAPLLVVHRATDTNVPVSESERLSRLCGRSDRPVRYLLFGDGGHEITRRENHAVPASTVADWVRAAFGPMFRALIGVFATRQRGYFSNSEANCATAGSIALTVMVGPLNGVILLVVGAVLWLLGAVGRPVGGRRYWY